MLEKREIRFQMAGGLALLLASFFSLGYHHFDEHFQILEFVNFKLGVINAHQLPWEYGAKMRPTVQPFMVYALHRFWNLFGEVNPFYMTFFLRFISALFSFYVMRLFYTTFKTHFKQKEVLKWFTVLSFTTWFVIYNGVRFSSENWSALFFMLPFTLYFKWKSKKLSHYFFIGLCLGLSFEFRFQAAFMTLGFLAWLLFLQKEKWSHMLLITLGGLAALVLGTLSDHWFYNEWTLSPWNYFYENILAGKASNFGEMPWYWYFKRFFVQGIPPFSLLVILAFLLFCIRQWRSPISWTVIPFLIVHFAISHKELRFLFPIALFVPFILVKAYEIARSSSTQLLQHKAIRFIFSLAIITNLIFLVIVSFRPANPQISLYRTLYQSYTTPTVLYHFEQNPYHRVLDISYYKRNNLRFKRIQSLEDISSDSSVRQLLVYGGKNRPSPTFQENHQLVYSSFPKWMKAFNFNGWQERTKVWNVYELE